MNDQLERDIRNLFCNTGELSRDEVTGILLGLLDRIQHLEKLQPEQEPVAWRWRDVDGLETIQSVKPYHEAEPLYTAPQQRKPLTDEEIKQMGLGNYIKVVRETEAAHGIKGEA